MKSLVDGVDQKFTDVGKRNPQWTGKKALLMHGALWQGTVVATMAGWRTDFLNQMGLVIADSVKPFGTDQRAVIPRDHIKSVLDSADVVIWTTRNPDDQKALLADPEVAGSLTTAQNRHIFTTAEQAGAIAFASPLSYPSSPTNCPRCSPKSWASRPRASWLFERLLRQLWQCSKIPPPPLARAPIPGLPSSNERDGP